MQPFPAPSATHRRASSSGACPSPGRYRRVPALLPPTVANPHRNPANEQSGTSTMRSASHAAVRHQSQRPERPDFLRMVRRLRRLQQIIQARRILRQAIRREFHLDAGLPHTHVIGVQRGRRQTSRSACSIALFPASDPRAKQSDRPRRRNVPTQVPATLPPAFVASSGPTAANPWPKSPWCVA